jgi:hypothetical protein
MLNTCAAPPDPEAAEHELATLSSHLDAATHRQLELIRVIDETGHWHAQGAASCAHWLGWRIGLDPGAARERLRVAHALASLPVIDGALRRGAISYSKVRAMTRVATPANEARLLGLAEASTAAQLEKICRGLRRLESDDGERPERLDRWVTLRHRGDGSVRIEASLAPDEAKRVMEAIRATCAAMRAESADARAEAKPTLADALVRMADATLAAPRDDADEPAPTRTTGADRAQVVVHFAPDALDEGYQATLDDGARVPAETFRRVACDCALVAVAKDARGDVLDVGRKTRSIPPALRRAVMLRDERCRFPGCAHDRFIDVHHVEHWIDGGETKLTNLVALCTHHHHLLHEGGFAVELDASRDARFFAPNGARIPDVHVPAETPAEPGRAFEAHHHARGIDIDDVTGLTRWDGRPPDYHACVAAAAGVGW